MPPEPTEYITIPGTFEQLLMHFSSGLRINMLYNPLLLHPSF